MNKLIKVTAVILAACLASVFAGIRFLSARGYKRAENPQYTYKYYYEHYADQYPRKEVKIPSRDKTLAGFIYGEENNKALLVFSHGSGGFHEDYMKDILWFVDHGYRVFAADYTASGYSEGDYTGGLAKTPMDLDKVLTYIENDEALSRMDKVLYGHSWGAYGVTAVLNYDHVIKAVASLAAYNDPAEQVANILSRVLHPALKVLRPMYWLNNVIDYGRYGTLTAVDGINKADIPVLVVQGTGDQMISYDKSSIVADKKKITNPKVQYMIFKEEGANDHDSFFFTPKAREILKELNEKLGQLNQAFNGHVPAKELEKLYAGLDKDTLNAPNEEFLSKVNAFFEASL